MSFSPPDSDGGCQVSSYDVTASPGGTTLRGSTSPVVFGDLMPGQPYTFRVAAVNEVGVGSASVPSAAVTPTNAPGPVAQLPADTSQDDAACQGATAKLARAKQALKKAKAIGSATKVATAKRRLRIAKAKQLAACG